MSDQRGQLPISWKKLKGAWRGTHRCPETGIHTYEAGKKGTVVTRIAQSVERRKARNGALTAADEVALQATA